MRGVSRLPIVDEKAKKKLVEELVNMTDELWCVYRNLIVREDTGVNIEDFNTDFPYEKINAVRELFGLK